MSEYTREVWIRIFMLAVWLALAAGGVSILDPERDTSAMIAVALALVAGLSILRPFPASHLVLAGTIAVIYAGVQGLRATATNADPDALYYPAAAAGAFALALTAIVGDSIRGALLSYDEELRARQRVLEEIEVVDARTGATKRTHADRLMNQEVERARRYSRKFTILVIGPDNWDDVEDAQGSAQAERMVRELSAEYLARLRSVDTLIQMDGATFAALLPETEIEGAQIVAEKLAAAGEQITGVDIRAGIAAFPDDEVTGSGLIREAEEALAFAGAASIQVASRSLLS